MRDRWITALGAIGALVVVYALFLQRPGDPPVTRPLSTEAGRNGYLGLRTWLERGGIAVVSLQERFDRLADGSLGLAPSGNVMITTMPHLRPLRVDEHLSLDDWLAAGNTLLILAALDDTPEWSPLADTTNFMRDLAWLTALSFSPDRPEDAPADDSAVDARVRADTAIELEPAAAHPLLIGVGSLRGFSDRASALWVAESGDPYRLVLRLAVERSTGLDAMWQLPRGAGQIVLAASGTLLSNANIAEADASRFVVNLLGLHLGAGGTVIFDDFHQGLSRLYDAAALFRDPRLHRTLLFLVAAWLVYLLGSSNRLAAPAAVHAEPRQGDFLAAAGGFMARRLDRRAAGLLLIEEWFDEVRRARGLAANGAPPWAELEATPTLAKRTYDELRRCHERLTNGRPVDLVHLHNILQQAREAIG